MANKKTETEDQKIIELVRVKLDTHLDIVALIDVEAPKDDPIDYHLVRYKPGDVSKDREPVEVRALHREDVDTLLSMRSKAK